MKSFSKNKLILVREEELAYNDNLQNAEDVAYFLQNIIKLHEEVEEVVILLCLDAKLQVVSYFEVSRGTLSMSFVHPREIFKRAIISNCKGIIIAHNHPSDNFEPSEQDYDMTKQIKKCGELLDIPLIDSLIITSKNYYSFKEEKNL